MFIRGREIYVSLLKKAKKDFYGNLNPSLIADNKTFWKVVKPFFSNKVKSSETIFLREDIKIHENDKDIANIFNEHFINAATKLDICIDHKKDYLNTDNLDPVLKAIDIFKDHPSILNIRDSSIQKNKFYFKPISISDIAEIISFLDSSKSGPKYTLPIKVIKDNIDIFSNKLMIDFISSIEQGIFPCNFKFADVSPIFKKGDRLQKENYRPISILSTVSKIFEKIMFKQVNEFIEPILSKYLCGFRKNRSAQHCLIHMLGKLKKSLDNRGKTGILLTDLSKAFDCLDHDLLIAKLNAYGFSYKSLKLIHSYLNDRYQRTQINSNYSSWDRLLSGVPQGSILGPLLFNIYLSDLFISCKNSTIANFADDNSPYSCNKDIDSVISQLKNDSNSLFEWFSKNGFKANPMKFHLILSNSDPNLFLEIDNYKIFNKKSEKLLGINFDTKLNFDLHVSELCSKANKKLHALSRIACYMSMNQRKVIMKSFINSQFGYCPLVWMLHNRKLNARVNKIHEKSLRIVYNDRRSTFEELLIKDETFTIHVRNIQFLAIELYKVVNEISSELMSETFPLKESIKYFSKNIFKTETIHTENYGINSLAYLGPKIWALVPSYLKEIESLDKFKRQIKKWDAKKCPCHICKVFITGVGYI